MPIQSLTYFLPFYLFSEKRPKRVAPGSGLATAADGWVPGHGGRHVGTEAHGRFDPRPDATTGAGGAVSTGRRRAPRRR